MMPKWKPYSIEIGRLHRKGFIEGGIRPKIDSRTKEVFTGFTFWNCWSIQIRFTESIPGLILSARHQIYENLYHAFHFHPAIQPPADGWDCLDCYETRPHFHLYVDSEQKIMADREVLELVPFLLFVASRHHGNEQRFDEFRKEFCKSYSPHGLQISPGFV